jgi:hypothetical protein
LGRGVGRGGGEAAVERHIGGGIRREGEGAGSPGAGPAARPAVPCGPSSPAAPAAHPARLVAAGAQQPVAVGVPRKPGDCLPVPVQRQHASVLRRPGVPQLDHRVLAGRGQQALGGVPGQCLDVAPVACGGRAAGAQVQQRPGAGPGGHRRGPAIQPGRWGWPLNPDATPAFQPVNSARPGPPFARQAVSAPPQRPTSTPSLLGSQRVPWVHKATSQSTSPLLPPKAGKRPDPQAARPASAQPDGAPPVSEHSGVKVLRSQTLTVASSEPLANLASPGAQASALTDSLCSWPSLRKA